MGMYDYLRCDAPLPGSGWKPPHGLFQTKDLGRGLDTHTITAEGKLLLVVSPVGELHQCTQFTGTIRFYSSEGTPAELVWHEYVATFAQGQLQLIVEVSPPSNSQEHPSGTRTDQT